MRSHNHGYRGAWCRMTATYELKPGALYRLKKATGQIISTHADSTKILLVWQTFNR